MAEITLGDILRNRLNDESIPNRVEIKRSLAISIQTRDGGCLPVPGHFIEYVRAGKQGEVSNITAIRAIQVLFDISLYDAKKLYDAIVEGVR